MALDAGFGVPPGLGEAIGDEEVMSRSLVSTLVLVFGIGLLSSGCAIPGLKEANQRLKEQNDRLVSENNRLEQELVAGRRNSIPDFPGGENSPAASSDAAELLIPGGTDIGSNVQVERTPEGIRMTIPHRVFFAPGRTELSGPGKGVLKKIAKVLNDGTYKENTVRVEGHTDDVPVNKVRDRYPTNWELSTARACSVVRYLVSSGGVAKARIYPAGFADTRPVAGGKSVDSRQKNRRVEITILNQGA